MIGLGLGWKLYKPTTIVEGYQPEQVLEELNTTVFKRLPENVVPVNKNLKKAAKKIGGTLERTGTIKIQPKVSEGSPEGCKCDEITLDVGLVDQGDGKRMIAHTDDATIIDGSDVALKPYTVNKETKWEVGAVIPVENPEGVGAYASRKLGPFSIGIQAAKPYAKESYTAMATVGIRF